MQLSYQKKNSPRLIHDAVCFSIYWLFPFISPSIRNVKQKCEIAYLAGPAMRRQQARFLRKSNWFRIIYNWNDLPPFPPKNKNEEKSNWHTQILGYILGTETFNEFKMMGFFAVIIHSSIYPFIYAGRCDGSSQFTVRFQKNKKKRAIMRYQK